MGTINLGREQEQIRSRNWNSLIVALLIAGSGLLASGSLVMARSAVSAAQKHVDAKAGSGSLADQLRNSDVKHRAKAAREMGKNGNIADIPSLVAALRDPSAEVRRQVIIALAAFRTLPTLDGLIEATRDTDPEARTLAVEGIIGYYTGQPPGTGFVAFFEKQYRRAKQRFAPDNTQVDPGTAVDPRTVSALAAVMMDTRFDRAPREAARGLGILVARAAVPDLVKAAHAPDENLARQALDSLAKIRDASAGPQLLDLLNSSDQNIQRDAAVTIGLLRTRQAVPKLQSMFQSGQDQKTREKALEGLAYIGDPVSIPIFLKALWSHDKDLRTSAAEGLGRARDPKTLPDLQKAAVVEKDADTKLAMEFALVSLGDYDYLSEMVNDLGARFHASVAQAYLIELSQNPAFLPKLYPFLNSRDANVRRQLYTVLMYAGNQSSLEPLEKASHDSNGDVAAQALRALRSVRLRISGQGTATGTP